MSTPRKSLEIYCMIGLSCKFILSEKSDRDYQFCINLLCGLKAKIHKLKSIITALVKETYERSQR